jgi:gag-polyprotein putative aspartyl protease
VLKRTILVALSGLCLTAAVAIVGGAPRRALAAAQGPVTIASRLNQTRPAIPVSINGARFDCVLDTGTSAIIVSPWVAQATRLPLRAATYELSPDGHTYSDRHTDIAHFAVGGYMERNVSALVSSNLTGADALCGYDFFARFPTLIDRDRQSVTLFPTASALHRLHCLLVDLSPRVPLATVQINGTWVDHIVLDSGMVGGGALWDGVRDRLHEPLIADADYETDPSAVRQGLACGTSANVRFVNNAPRTSLPICTEPQPPDGYNGILETYLPTIHAMAVDYPHRRICFDTNGSAEFVSTGAGTGYAHDAWGRFNDLRGSPPR